ncbi:MAG TPA: PKD domain-containing protein [Thermoplasmata archaeon]|nr:PKD domain-containing protein [Thermoplasmata archaeon]
MRLHFQNRTAPTGLIAAFALVLLLIGPGPFPAGSLRSAQAPLTGGTPPASDQVQVAPAFLPTGSVRTIGLLPPATPLAVTVSLARSDPAGLDAQILAEYAPTSPSYHHFLTPLEIADRYGPSAASYDAAVAYFDAFGLRVTPSPDRTMLFLSGTESATARAFDTSFQVYRTADRSFFSHATPARLPAGIPWLGVVGLGNETRITPDLPSPTLVRPLSPPLPPAPCASSSWVTPCSAHVAYNLTTLLASGENGTGWKVGIVDTYDAAETANQLAADYASFVKTFSLPSGNVSYVYPVPNSGNLNQSYTGWAAELALDLEWTRAMAPGASIDMTLAPNSNAALYEAVDWLVAHDAVNVLTMSWGENDVGVFNAFLGPCQSACNASSDGSYQSLHPVLEAAAAEGISLFSASGDCGAADGTGGVSTNYPGSDPYVTGVGGTDLTLTTNGGYGGETGWAGNSSGSSSPGCGNQGGSGGGYSPFPRPTWQSAPGVSPSLTRRGVPDVSILGGSPGAEIVIGGGLSVEGGTSLSSPMWAGIAADADSYYGAPLGFLNPSLYAIARSSSASLAYHDITQGWNGYNAGVGWDPVTGLGSPNAIVLVPLLTSTSVVTSNLTVGLTATPRFGNAPLTVRFHANASGGTGRVSFFDVGFGDGNSTISLGGSASYTFPTPGIFPAIATAFDSQGNSSISQPVTIVVGGGGPLSVALNVTPARPSVGGLVTLRANVTGGSAPYTYTYLFGDGTTLGRSNQSTVTHVYRSAGGYCPIVVVSDGLTPPDGGESSAVALPVGPTATARCATSPALRTLVSASPAALDLPGGFTFTPVTTGGVPPYGVTYTANDPYSTACRCAIFSTTGNHTVRATVSDSLDAVAVATTNVTLYPALSGAFTASPQSGVAPLRVNFTATLSGGHLANASTTRWTFGDGTNATGAAPAHTYLNPGFYVATALSTDGFGGHASAALLIDAYATGTVPSTILTAEISPALFVPVGDPIAYTARAIGSQSPYLLHWSLGANGSAFGTSVSQTYSYDGCGSPTNCPLSIGLGARGSDGRWLNLTIPVFPSQAGNASALTLALSAIPNAGVTPLTVRGRAMVQGMPGASTAWSFGDGAVGSGQYGNHTYLTPGNYTVSATSIDPYGDQLVETRALTVSGIQRYSPVVTGGPNVSSGVGPLSIRFSATASGGAGGPYHYAWTFGDGAIGSGSPVVHVYDDPGSYVANLTATDRLGDPAMLQAPITVYAVTPLTLTISGLPTPAASGTVLPVSVWEWPSCGPNSVPRCTTSLPAVRYVVQDAALPPPTNATAPTASTLPNPAGYANFTIRAPGSPGAYVLYAWANASGFYGNSSAAFTVSGSTGTRPTNSTGGPMVLYGSIAVGAIVVAVAIVVLARRRRPANPPGEDADPTP